MTIQVRRRGRHVKPSKTAARTPLETAPPFYQAAEAQLAAVAFLTALAQGR